MKWSDEHDLVLYREVLLLEPFVQHKLSYFNKQIML